MKTFELEPAFNAAPGFEDNAMLTITESVTGERTRIQLRPDEVRDLYHVLRDFGPQFFEK